MANLDELAVENFRRYLRIPSVHPDPDLDDCVRFLVDQAANLGLSIQVIEFVAKKPVVILSWEGLKPQLPSILLNGHMDVVPVFEEKWTHDPFGAEMDEEGNIYARGAQDMKGVCIQYLEAIRRLQLDGTRLNRSVHVSFMPDEEIGGKDGMKLLVKSEQFRKLNVGFALDEGNPTENENFVVRYGEKCIWRMHFYCPGQTGHGSLLLENTPGIKVSYLLNKITELRAEQQKLLKDNPTWTIGDVISINLTILHGGVQSNVIPDQFDFVVDSRIPLTTDLKKHEEMLESWCKEAGEGVWVDYESKNPQIPATKLDDSNQYWVAFKNAAEELKINVLPQILGGATNSRYIRELGIPALGFSPMNNTPNRLHYHDEFLNKKVFLNGIPIYMKLITALANAKE